MISTLSVGTEHIDLAECKRRNIEVLNTPDVASDSAAEFTVTLVLLVARRLLEGKNGMIPRELAAGQRTLCDSCERKLICSAQYISTQPFHF